MSSDPRIDRASRLIRARVPDAYRALIDPDAWLAWLPPEGMRGAIERFDPRPGGGYRLILTYVSEGKGKTRADADVVEGEFVDLTPNRSVTHRLQFASDDPRFAGAMIMVWTVAPAGDETEVTITARDVPPGISPEDHAVGLASSLDNLAAYLERDAAS